MFARTLTLFAAVLVLLACVAANPTSPMVSKTTPGVFESFHHTNGDKCTCVPYYMCDSEHEDLLDLGQFSDESKKPEGSSSNSRHCTSVLEVCCQNPKRYEDVLAENKN